MRRSGLVILAILAIALAGCHLGRKSGTVAKASFGDQHLIESAPIQDSTPTSSIQQTSGTEVVLKLEPGILHLKNPAQLNVVFDDQRPVLLDFYADWCGPCKKQAKTLKQLDLKQLGAHVVKINVDEFPELAERYSAEKLPTLIVIKEGKETYRKTGYHSADSLRGLLR